MTPDQLPDLVSAVLLALGVPGQIATGLIAGGTLLRGIAASVAPYVHPPVPESGIWYRSEYVLLNLAAGNYGLATNANAPHITGAANPDLLKVEGTKP